MRFYDSEIFFLIWILKIPWSQMWRPNVHERGGDGKYVTFGGVHDGTAQCHSVRQAHTGATVTDGFEGRPAAGVCGFLRA